MCSRVILKGGRSRSTRLVSRPYLYHGLDRGRDADATVVWVDVGVIHKALGVEAQQIEGMEIAADLGPVRERVEELTRMSVKGGKQEVSV